MQRSNRVIVLLTAMSLGAAMPAVAADAHDCVHEAAPRQAATRPGRTWGTEALLRQGMAEIRNAFAADKEAIQTGKMSTSKYDALAAKIDVAFVLPSPY